MTANILVIGDVVGKSGLDFLYDKLRGVKRYYDAAFTVVNGENASNLGITPQQADMILNAGADVITLGNHTFRRMSIVPYLDDCPYILRPLNLAPQNPGRGYGVFDAPFGKVMTVNLIGRLGLDFGPDNPFLAMDRLLKEEHPAVTIVDFHAEATSEQLAMGFHLDGRASAVYGTHTHVQTSDATVLPKGTGYVTDVGMTGPAVSVLGVKPEQSVAMFLGNPRERFDSAPGPAKLEGAVFCVDTDSGRCLKAETVRITE